MKHKHLPSIFILSLIFSISAFSQNLSPKISFQGTLKDDNGKSVSDGEHTVKFRLYDSQTSDEILWEEEASVDVTGGIYSHYLGGNPLAPLNSAIFDQTLFLGIKVGSFELVPRSELTYAPYTFAASTVTCSGALGDVKYSILNPMQFEAANGDCWVPMDGASMSGSALSVVIGSSNVPDMSGLFMRAQEYNEGNDPDRTTSTAVASLQSDSYKSHTHNVSISGFTNSNGSHSHSYNDYHTEEESITVEYDIDMQAANGDGTIRGYDSRSTGGAGSHNHYFTASADTNASGSGETRSKNRNFYAYIRIN